MKRLTTLLLIFCFVCCNLQAQDTNYSFKVIPLGVKGGVDESNLSAYMIAPKGSNNYACLDAGTLYYGIKKAVDNGVFQNNAFYVLKHNIKGYLLSHPHLDHVAGLIINSPVDTTKFIYGLPSCLDVLQKDYFTWGSWANFGDTGEKPVLNKYHYISLEPAKQIAIANTSMLVTPYVLSHVSPYQSTAFLISDSINYLLYLGDTGADTIEHTHNLQQLWKAITPIITTNKLKAIFIEVSFDNSQPSKLLFGHLTPTLLFDELRQLAAMCNVEELKKVPIVITHIKPSEQDENVIQQQLLDANTNGYKLVFPQQGELLKF